MSGVRRTGGQDSRIQGFKWSKLKKEMNYSYAGGGAACGDKHLTYDLRRRLSADRGMVEGQIDSSC